MVAGGGGFIGGHLVGDLLARGHAVRSVDVKPFDEWYQRHDGAENLRLDLQEREACASALDGAATVYNLAADMGGMGFIENNKALCMLSVLINTHLLMAARDAGVERFFFSSSACVYNAEKQKDPNVVPLKEADAYPAMPEDGYGWEKLFSERMCRHFREDFGLDTRVARYHNVYGPHGTWEGGREKAPGGDLPQGDRGQAQRRPLDRDLGRRQADPLVHLHRRLPRGHPAVDRERRRRAAERRIVGAGDDRRPGVDRRGDRRHHARAPLRHHQAQGGQRQEQRQHQDPGAARLGAVGAPARRHGAHLRLDLGRVRRQVRRAAHRPHPEPPAPPRRASATLQGPAPRPRAAARPS